MQPIAAAMRVHVLGCAALALLVMTLQRVRASQVVLKNFSVGFTKALEDCKREMDLPDSIMSDFADFWKDDFVMTNPKSGCAILCLATKLDLLDPDGQLHHGNTREFAKKHGADESMAAELVQMVHSCFESTPEAENPCVKVMNIAMCFKKKVHDLKWNPDMELLMGEVLAEV